MFWENLTVDEHIRIWRKLKNAAYHNPNEDDGDVLAECDLLEKGPAKAKTLSGGQMRKLQLAIAFVGGSKVCCIDEASSGLVLFPLPYPALFRVLILHRTPCREEISGTSSKTDIHVVRSL